MRQGKCPKCKTVFEWGVDIHSKRCACPRGHGPLRATSHLSKLPRVKVCPHQVDPTRLTKGGGGG